MKVFNDGYICKAYANSILQRSECITYIFWMGGLSGIYIY